MLDPKTIFNYLSGLWSFERDIYSETEKTFTAKVKGEAEFKQIEEEKYLYLEKGQMTINTEQEFEVTKKYIYQYEKNTIVKYYFDYQDQKKELFSLKFNQSTINPNASTFAEGKHLCRDDWYFVNFNFSNIKDSKEFDMRYRIQGPKKDNILSTKYAKHF